MAAVTTIRPVTPAELRMWRLSRLHAGDGEPMSLQEAADYFQVSPRSFQRYEGRQSPIPGWLARFVLQDIVPTGYYRVGGAR